MARRIASDDKKPAAQLDVPKDERKPSLELVNGMLFVPLRPGIRKAA